MPKCAANLTMLFTEHPFLDRFEHAAKAGFQAVEFLFPYAWPAGEIRQRLDANGLKLVLHNLPAGDWDAGERGIACHPDRTVEFREGVARGIAYAGELGVAQLNCLAGKAPTGRRRKTWGSDRKSSPCLCSCLSCQSRERVWSLPPTRPRRSGKRRPAWSRSSSPSGASRRRRRRSAAPPGRPRAGLRTRSRSTPSDDRPGRTR